VKNIRAECGFALVAVLWGLSILSLLCASIISIANISSRSENNLEVAVEASALADAGIARAIVDLINFSGGTSWPTDGTPREFSYIGVPMRVSIEDESGKIDLNAADALLLSGLFQSQGLAADQATLLTNRVLDWRSASNLHSLGGGPNNALPGRAYRPRQGPFQSVDELNLVAGITPEFFARVAPALTVHSLRPVFDSRTAPEQALLALPGMDKDKVASAITSRGRGFGDPIARGGAVAVGLIDPTASPAGRAFTIRVELNYKQRHFVHHAIMRITQDPLRPYLVLEWS